MPHDDIVRRIRPQFAAAKIVSFDVFDTLIERPFMRPTDLFRFMEADVGKILRGTPIGFGALRVEAEQEARERAPHLEDITLDAIYAVVRERMRIDAATAERLRDLELEVERSLCAVRPEGRALYDLALELERRVVFASDMYLPSAFVRELLVRNGFSADARLFLSSETGKTKRTGTLYGEILRELGARPEEVIHVGDNRYSDVESAEANGLRAVHLEHAERSFRWSKSFERVYGADAAELDVARDSMLTVLGRGVARGGHVSDDDTLFGGSARRLGYLGLGPLLLGFAQWTLESAKRDGVRHLYFLARDAEIVMRAYEILAEGDSAAPRATYALCSRRSANVASLETLEDIEGRVLGNLGGASLAEVLENKLGLAPSEVPREIFERHRFALDQNLKRRRREEIRALLSDLAAPVLANARREREAYVAYLEHIGLAGGEKVALVDIGYACSIQASLNDLLGPDARIDGYYLITTKNARDALARSGARQSSYLASFVDKERESHPFFRYVPMYETLFSTDKTSFVKMSREGERLEPVFMAANEAERTRIDLVRDIQSGALELVRDARDAYRGHLHSFAVHPNVALRALDTFLSRPDAADARLFMGVLFENAFGAAELHALVPSESELSTRTCLWEEGRQAILAPARSHRRSQLDALAGAAVRFFVDRIVVRALPRAKATKLRNDPARFFSDSRNRYIQMLGRRYLHRRL